MSIRLIRLMPLAVALALTAGPAFAAEPAPTPTPQPLPIRGVTVDVQRNDSAPGAAPNAHIERPPMMFRSFRATGESAKTMAAPAAPVPATPTPTPTPAGRR